MSQEIFKKLPQSEKKNVIKEMISDRIYVTVKGDEDDLMSYQAIGVENEFTLITAREKDNKRLISPQRVLVSFIRGDDRFFCQTIVQARADHFAFDLSGDMFILQRRKAARVFIPDTYRAEYNLIQMKGRAVYVETRIQDYSSGGLKIACAKAEPKLTVGDIYKGVMHLGNRRPLELEAEVRHIQNVVENDITFQIVGIRFVNLNPIIENKLITITMDLHREFFLRMENS